MSVHVSIVKSFRRRPRARHLILLGSLLTAGAAALSANVGVTQSPRALERRLRDWLDARMGRAFVSVRAVDDGGVEAVVNAVPEGDVTEFRDEDARRMAENLRRNVLAPISPRLDFATGSQFSILGSEELEVAGAGDELTRSVQNLAMNVVREATDRGLSVQYLSATARGVGEVTLELETRGVGLGPGRQSDVREELLDAIRARVFAGGHAWMHFDEEASYLEVWDVEPPREVRPRTAARRTAPAGVAPRTPAMSGEPAIADPGVEAWPSGEGAAPDEVAMEDPGAGERAGGETPPATALPPEWWTEEEGGGTPSEPEIEDPGIEAWPSGEGVAPDQVAGAPGPEEPAGADGALPPATVTADADADADADAGDGDERPSAPASGYDDSLGSGAFADEVAARGLPDPRYRTLPSPRLRQGGAGFDGSDEDFAPPTRNTETTDLARLVREVRARHPWNPPLTPGGQQQPPGPEPPREYPASPFGIGPGVASTIEVVYFDTDKAVLKPESQAKLERLLAKEIRVDWIRNVHVVGHADDRSTDAYNLDLGRRRARSVQAFLVSQGLDSRRVEVTSYGERDPVVPNSSDRTRSLNRRAEIRISYGDPDRRMHSTESLGFRGDPRRRRPPDHNPDGYPKYRDG